MNGVTNVVKLVVVVIYWNGGMEDKMKKKKKGAKPWVKIRKELINRKFPPPYPDGEEETAKDRRFVRECLELWHKQYKYLLKRGYTDADAKIVEFVLCPSLYDGAADKEYWHRDLLAYYKKLTWK